MKKKEKEISVLNTFIKQVCQCLYIHICNR